MQAKTIRRVKKSKPAEEDIANEPGTATIPGTSNNPPPPEPAADTPAPTSDPSVEDMVNSFLNPDPPSPAKIADPEVEVLKTQFVPPGQSSTLAKCSGKTDLLDHQRRRLDSADFAQLSLGEIVSG